MRILWRVCEPADVWVGPEPTGEDGLRVSVTGRAYWPYVSCLGEGGALRSHECEETLLHRGERPLWSGRGRGRIDAWLFGG
jgi:hypothetical protein